MAPVKVVLGVDEFVCDAITREEGIPIFGDNTRDEVYMFVTGDSSRGLISQRLPAPDDYYEFEAGHRGTADDYRSWTNQDQRPVGRPILWAGELNDKEGTNVFVVIGEQDNKDLGPLKRALSKGAELVRKALGGKNPLVDAGLGAADALIGAIPEIDHDDVIGAFMIHVRNEDGRIQMAWVPWPNYELDGGMAGATTIANPDGYAVTALQAGNVQAIQFDFRATIRGHYRGIVTARIVSEFIDEQYEFLGDEIDRCGATVLYVSDRNRGLVAVEEGQGGVRVDVPGARFYWYCGDENKGDDDKDWTTAPPETDLVLVTRGASRKIVWACYRDHTVKYRHLAVQGQPLLAGAAPPAVAPLPAPIEAPGAPAHMPPHAPKVVLDPADKNDRVRRARGPGQ